MTTKPELAPENPTGGNLVDESEHVWKAAVAICAGLSACVSFAQVGQDKISEWAVSQARELRATFLGVKIEEEIGKLREENERLRKAIEPFARLVSETNGRIPVERLSFCNWHDLSKAYKS